MLVFNVHCPVCQISVLRSTSYMFAWKQSRDLNQIMSTRADGSPLKVMYREFYEGSWWGSFDKLNLKETLSQEEHKTIFSGLKMNDMALWLKWLSAFFCLWKMNFCNYIELYTAEFRKFSGQ